MVLFASARQRDIYLLMYVCDWFLYVYCRYIFLMVVFVFFWFFSDVLTLFWLFFMWLWLWHHHFCSISLYALLNDKKVALKWKRLSLEENRAKQRNRTESYTTKPRLTNERIKKTNKNNRKFVFVGASTWQHVHFSIVKRVFYHLLIS